MKLRQLDLFASAYSTPRASIVAPPRVAPAAPAAPAVDLGPVGEPADEDARMLRSLGLPWEAIVNGERRCRHHPSARIRWRADPCPACRSAARGLFGPLVDVGAEGEEVGRGS